MSFTLCIVVSTLLCQLSPSNYDDTNNYSTSLRVCWWWTTLCLKLTDILWRIRCIVWTGLRFSSIHVIESKFFSKFRFFVLCTLLILTICCCSLLFCTLLNQTYYVVLCYRFGTAVVLCNKWLLITQQLWYGANSVLSDLIGCLQRLIWFVRTSRRWFSVSCSVLLLSRVLCIIALNHTF